MQLSDLLPAKVTDQFFWPSKHSSKAYRVWMLKEKELLQAVGVMASCISELKQKVFNSFKQMKPEDVSLESVSMVTLDDGILINDDDYLRQMLSTEELLLLLPGQTWNEIQQLKLDTRREEKSLTALSQNVKSDFRYFIPTPDGEMARFTVDVYRERPSDAGCVRLTAATAGDTGMTVSYELRLNGAKTIIHCVCRWTAVMLTCVGKLMVETGELIKRRLH